MYYIKLIIFISLFNNLFSQNKLVFNYMKDSVTFLVKNEKNNDSFFSSSMSNETIYKNTNKYFYFFMPYYVGSRDLEYITFEFPKKSMIHDGNYILKLKIKSINPEEKLDFNKLDFKFISISDTIQKEKISYLKYPNYSFKINKNNEIVDVSIRFKYYDKYLNFAIGFMINDDGELIKFENDIKSLLKQHVLFSKKEFNYFIKNNLHSRESLMDYSLDYGIYDIELFKE